MEIETQYYIQSIESVLGYEVPDYKLSAIDLFIVKEKDAGRWDLHKYIWLPVWNNTPANKICLKNGVTIGSYPRGITLGDGYVKGNGETQYFDSGIRANDVLSANNTHLFALIINNPANGTFYGVGQNALNLDILENTGFIYSLSGYSGNGYNGDKIENTGFIYSLSGYSGNAQNQSPIENTGFVYQLSGYVKDPIITPISDNTGLLWTLSGGLI